MPGGLGQGLEDSSAWTTFPFDQRIGTSSQSNKQRGRGKVCAFRNDWGSHEDVRSSHFTKVIFLFFDHDLQQKIHLNHDIHINRCFDTQNIDI